ncbi:hypothetical protein ACFYRY_34060 [Streptomyces sp. NPDC005263]|uniref:hypothetical protein n=1 Tax=Streptomyces sp. NPDC005263 TaxID=3364711 RepID=UPI0036AACD80
MAGKRQLKELVRAAAVDVAAFSTARTRVPSTSEVLLVLSADAKGIVMRPDALRPDTAKTAAGKKRGRGVFRTRLASEEKNCRKRMAALACSYDVGPLGESAGLALVQCGEKQEVRFRALLISTKRIPELDEISAQRIRPQGVGDDPLRDLSPLPGPWGAPRQERRREPEAPQSARRPERRPLRRGNDRRTPWLQRRVPTLVVLPPGAR